MLNKNDIKILYCLHTAGCTNDMKSYTIKKISEITELSNTKIRYTIRSLLAGEYIREGYSSGNASTYYITDKGKEVLRGCNS